MNGSAAGASRGEHNVKAGAPPSPGAATCPHPGGLELTGRVVALAGLTSGARLLDVGCGDGATVAHLVERCGLRAIGLDASRTQVARALRARPDLDIALGRAEALPFADGVFDAVLAECVLSTLPDPGRALAEMARVLAPGGCVLLTDLYDDGDGRARPPSALPSLGRREAVEGLVAAAGLGLEVWEDHSGQLLRLLWDHAGPRPAHSGGAASASPAERAAAAAASRRLGYFACVARAAGGPRRA